MSISFLFFLAVIIAICVFVFTKTVSNDAKNDFRLRDILANSSDEKDIVRKPQTRVKTEEATVENVYANNIYEELANNKNNEQKTMSYSTTTHETPDETPKYNYEETQSKYSQEVHYEKINDDACTEEEEDFDNDYEESLYKIKAQKVTTKPSRNLFGYIKTFWRGITFTVGMLVSIYSFIGLAYNVQTSNDALIYSLWLLIGVILIK